jgi:thiamine-phosphate pyrophosphorylase
MGFELIVITLEQNHPKEIETITSLFELGLQRLHVRKPNANTEELREYIQCIPKHFHKIIVIHSHYELTKEFNLKGIHLTEKARELKSKGNQYKIVSTSFHTTKDILKSRRKYEYVFLSPVFDSISKQGYKSNFKLEDLKSFLKSNKNKVIALGGINQQNINQAKEMGFSGAAVLGYIWGSKNPIENYKKLLSKIK